MPVFRRILHLAANLRKNPLVRTLFVALGFTTIFLLWVTKPGVEPSQLALYHWSGSAKNFFVPIALDFLGFWFALTLLLLASRSPGRMRVAVWSGLLFFTPWFVLQNLEILGLTNAHELDRALFLIAFMATILLTALWRPEFAQRFESVMTAATTLLIFAGIFGIFMLCRLAGYGRQASLLAAGFPLHHEQFVPKIQPHRIIWIVFDELSYQQTYEDRFPGLQLPAFDALTKEATVFTNTVPPAIYTEIAMPDLLTGKPFDDIRTSSLAQLFVRNSSSGKWQPFDQHNTVFQDALDAGYSTALAGWFNPYCRIVPAVLDQCFWTNRPVDNTNGMQPSGSVLSNTLIPALSMATRVTTVGSERMQLFILHLLHIPLMKERRSHLHIEDYLDLNAASDKLLRDRSAGFILLHLPVPHPWGIYDRHTGKFTTASSSYINNLALADKCLAGLRQTLEQTGQWDSSTIVIMGDHSWRTKQLWRLPTIRYAWSQEDEDASHGGEYDPRPAYIVKLPGQTVGSRIDTPFHSVNTRKLFDAILAHRIITSADLAAWARSVQ